MAAFAALIRENSAKNLQKPKIGVAAFSLLYKIKAGGGRTQRMLAGEPFRSEYCGTRRQHVRIWPRHHQGVGASGGMACLRVISMRGPSLCGER